MILVKGLKGHQKPQPSRANRTTFNLQPHDRPLLLLLYVYFWLIEVLTSSFLSVSSPLPALPCPALALSCPCLI